MLGSLGLGFMYTNKDSITIGLGVTLNDLVEKNYKPFELLDQLKNIQKSLHLSKEQNSKNILHI